MTTIEYIQHKSEAQSADNDRDMSSFYDIGLIENLAAVLGENPLLRPFPVSSACGDGLSFPIRSEDGKLRMSQKTCLPGNSVSARRNPHAAQKSVPKQKKRSCQRKSNYRTRQSTRSSLASPAVSTENATQLSVQGVLQHCSCIGSVAQDAFARVVSICCFSRCK